MMWLGITIVCVVAVVGGLKLKRRWLARNRRLEREAIEATMNASVETNPDTSIFSFADHTGAAQATIDSELPTRSTAAIDTATPPGSAHVTTPEDSIQSSSISTARVTAEAIPETTPETATDTANSATEYQYLENLLKEQRYEEADRVTWRILLQLAGAEGRGYLELDEVMLLPQAEVIQIDQLWQHYSQGHWGFTVQRRLFEQADSDYSKLGKITGWMVDGIWLQQRNTIYDLEQSPRGHLPQEIWRNMFKVFDGFGLSLGIETFFMNDALASASPHSDSKLAIKPFPSDEDSAQND